MDPVAQVRFATILLSDACRLSGTRCFGSCLRSSPLISSRKTYPSGFLALNSIRLDIHRGEIFALLGPNGAGKTTLISSICGIVKPSSGSIHVGGFDIGRQFRQARRLIGLVPQELTTDSFESVWATVCYTRGLFGKNRTLPIWKTPSEPVPSGRKGTSKS